MQENVLLVVHHNIVIGHFAGCVYTTGSANVVFGFSGRIKTGNRNNAIGWSMLTGWDVVEVVI